MRVALTLSLLLVACQRAPKPDATPAASASVAALPSAAPAAAAPKRAWFEGEWSGSFDAELRRIEVAAGGVKEWKQDDGKQASGPGTLELQIGADGTVNGSGKGALGELQVSGHTDGDRATLTLSSAEPDGFHGYVLASQTPEGMQGSLSASRGDSLQARQAKVTLSRRKP